MKYYSLSDKTKKISFKDAVILGQAADKSLFFPEEIAKFEKDFFADIEKYSVQEIAFKVMQPYVNEDIADVDLKKIVDEVFIFPLPVKKVNDKISVLELFHGPTYAFKDVGARFMSRCLQHFTNDVKKKIVVLVATSGDTGGAVANGFYDVDGVEVVILFPKNKVSKLQQKQLTTLGKNIHALEVNGNFDDCQQIVKTAFTDDDLKKNHLLTSANSINVARWLPQQVYYYLAWQQWTDKSKPPIISVPSGNFGNICAGLLAHISGLPVAHFIAACNANDVIPNYFATQQLQPKPAVATISNAMDVGNPSNFVRILNLFNNDFVSLSAVLSSVSISDDETKATIDRVYKTDNYILDPHGAVAYLALEKYLQKNDEKGLYLATAHPAKFCEIVEPVIKQKIKLSAEMEALLLQDEKLTSVEANYEAFKDWFGGVF